MFAFLKNKSPGVLIPFLLIGCRSEESAPLPKPRPVITFRVTENPDGSSRRFSGETKAARSVQLGFELTGRIDTLLAEEGKRYSKGTVLAQLDASNVNADLQNAEAQALQAVQQLRRTQELLESGNASQADFDSAIANQKAAEAKLSSAKLAVKYTNLVMPYDGVVAEIPADVNQVVSAGSPVISIQGNLGMDFEIGVPTSVISRIQENQEVTLVINDLGKKKVTGIVSKISPVAAQNTTYPVTISIQDSEKIANLRSGLDGEAIFKFADQGDGGFPVPGSAILASADGSNFVWLIDNPDQPTSTVTRTAVTIAKLADSGLVTITEGLNSGQLIVTKGVQNLTPGMEVSLPRD